MAAAAAVSARRWPSCAITQWRFHRSGSRCNWVASQAVGCSKVKRLRMVLPSSKITMVGANLMFPTTIVSWRRLRMARAITSPAAVPTRTVTGMRKASGVVKRSPVLSALDESCWVCCTSTVTVPAAESYLAATVNSGYPA